ncbi:CHRD domain-containing protein [Photobacterium sp. J15]|uniref:CHRD domain-containing protein n=1 Tax=Photobacterium sp. J15 TaxID=265901 RepID=UPI0007E425AC|nr:CHRD domain-containing protein [Photobacterium sp. J15]
MSRKFCFAVLLALFSLLGCHEEELTFNVSLSGNQEVPPVAAESKADAVVTLTIQHSASHLVDSDSDYDSGDGSDYDKDYDKDYHDDSPDYSDDDTWTLSAELDISMLTDVQAAHIHQGKIGVNGPVAFEFTNNNNGTMSLAETEITQEQAEELQSGKWYINVHTLLNPSGEVRGQIVDSNTAIVTFVLEGEQEVPPVDSEASGNGYATLNTENYAVDLTVITENADDATAAHIHEGFIGENGGVIVDLVAGDTSGTWMTPENTTLDEETANRLINGGHYVNVHTPANESGEIRGQILTDDFTLLTFSLDGEQEVPAVETEASGSGYATYNSTTEALDLKVLTSGVDDAEAAHLHEGFIGQNGSVIVGLEQDPDDVTIWTSPNGTTLDTETVTRLLAGGHYVNVHTPANESGEIRGQVLSKDFVLFTFPLDGTQEVPPVDTEASGSGYATFNQMTKELVARIVTTGIDDADEAHIHEGETGENGGVIVPLDQSEADVTVWETPDSVVLDEETANTLLSGGHYINVHTPANPDGEIRGQIE